MSGRGHLNGFGKIDEFFDKCRIHAHGDLKGLHAHIQFFGILGREITGMGTGLDGNFNCFLHASPLLEVFFVRFLKVLQSMCLDKRQCLRVELQTKKLLCSQRRNAEERPIRMENRVVKDDHASCCSGISTRPQTSTVPRATQGVRVDTTRWCAVFPVVSKL